MIIVCVLWHNTEDSLARAGMDRDWAGAVRSQAFSTRQQGDRKTSHQSGSITRLDEAAHAFEVEYMAQIVKA
jgi:hypothetical protein